MPHGKLRYISFNYNNNYYYYFVSPTVGVYSRVFVRICEPHRGEFAAFPSVKGRSSILSMP